MRNRVHEIVTHPLFSGSAVMIIGSNGVSFLNYLYHLIMPRMLGPANYGELAALISLGGLLGTIPASLNLVVTKYISMSKNDADQAVLISWFRTKIFLICFIFSLLILASSPFLASFLHINQILYLVLVSLSLLFSLQAGFNRSILQGLLKFKEMVASSFLENISKLLISVLLIYLGFQVGGAMLGFVLSTILGWYITNLYLRHRVKQASPKLDLKEMLLFSIPVLVQSVSVTSIFSTDVILVKHFFSSYDAGIYAALSTLGKIVFFGAGPISAVMFPLVSKRSARGEDYNKIFLYSFVATFLLTAIILLIYWLYPSQAISLLFGTKYLQAQSLLIWFGVFMALFTLSSLLINYGLSLGRTSIVIFPLIAAILQVAMIWSFHQTLSIVVFISIFSMTLLLASLLIYSMVWKIRRSPLKRD